MNNELLNSLDKIHTTELGEFRIKRNLGIDEDVVEYCINIIKSSDSEIIRKGKNYYVSNDFCVVTINGYSYTIITAHKRKMTII